MSIYADNSATTPLRQEVREAMLPYLTDKWGNPSSLHEPGHIAHDAIAAARENIAALLNCTSEEIYFAGSGTLSNNIALLGRARFAQANGQGNHLITTTIEHSAVLGPAQFLEASGWQVTYLPVSEEGLLEIDDLRRAITPQTSIISIAWANNEIGSLQPIDELAELAKQIGIFFHTDAIQVTGKLPIDLQKLPVSALSLSGHKFYAPKGIGALFVRNGQPIMPITFGGGQEQGLFPGTESVPNIVGMGMAAQLALSELQQNQTFLRSLQKELMEKLSSIEGITFTGPVDLNKRLTGHVSLVATGRSGESLVLRCDLHGIYLSSGSACHGRAIEPSHVLRAIGLADEEALGSLRISFGKFNTLAECEEIATVLDNVLRTDEHAIQVSMAGSKFIN
jgi:cysteine desulfurase